MIRTLTSSATSSVFPPTKNRPLFGKQTPISNSEQRLAEIINASPAAKTFCDLIAISTPTTGEYPGFETAIQENMSRFRELLKTKFDALNLGARFEEDDYGSLIVRIPGASGLSDLRPLMLVSHMDMVATDGKNPMKPVHPIVVNENGTEYIAGEDTNTGGDAKASLAVILDALAQLRAGHAYPPMELIFSPDEEGACQSLNQLNMSRFKAKHVLVVDEFTPFFVTTGLASAVTIDIKIHGLRGGHSGEDINKGRFSAVMIKNELSRKIGHGPIETGVWPLPLIKRFYRKLIKFVYNRLGKTPPLVHPVITINQGVDRGGSAYNAIPAEAEMKIQLRSHDQKAQDKELNRIRKLVKSLEHKSKQVEPGLQIDLSISDNEYPIWNADPESPIPGWAREAARRVNGPEVQTGIEHAAAQANILAGQDKENQYGESFDIGMVGPLIKGAHTEDEQVGVKELELTSRWLTEIIRIYTAYAQKTRLTA